MKTFLQIITIINLIVSCFGIYGMLIVPSPENGPGYIYAGLVIVMCVTTLIFIGRKNNG